MIFFINLFQQPFCKTVTSDGKYLIPSEDTVLQKDCWNEFIMELNC